MISVRVEPELVERLSTLAKCTHHPRSAYIRMALWATLLHLEHMQWDQVAADYENLAIKDAFEEIALGFIEDPLRKDRVKKTREGGLGKENGKGS